MSINEANDIENNQKPNVIVETLYDGRVEVEVREGIGAAELASMVANSGMGDVTAMMDMAKSATLGDMPQSGEWKKVSNVDIQITRSGLKVIAEKDGVSKDLLKEKELITKSGTEIKAEKEEKSKEDVLKEKELITGSGTEVKAEKEEKSKEDVLKEEELKEPQPKELEGELTEPESAAVEDDEEQDLSKTSEPVTLPIVESESQQPSQLSYDTIGDDFKKRQHSDFSISTDAQLPDEYNVEIESIISKKDDVQKPSVDFTQSGKEDDISGVEKLQGKDVRFVTESEFASMLDDSSVVDYGDLVVLPPKKKLRKRLKVTKTMDGDQELAEEVEAEAEAESVKAKEEKDKVPEAAPAVDRQFYYIRHEKLLKALAWEKLKNNYLQQRISVYFRKRRMEHVFKEDTQTEHNQDKFERKLDALDQLLKIDEKERNTINCEIRELENDRDVKRKKANALFHQLQKEELEATKGMTFAKSGNAFSDKAVEACLKRQRKKSELLQECRITFFKLKSKLKKKQEILRSLDDIGSHLHLIDYEQLKEDNRNHTDKLDERENELTKLRARCNGIMQMMAHIREKSSYLTDDLGTLNERLTDVDAELAQARQHAAHIKNTRDNFRLMTQKIKEETGLIMHNTILMDIWDTSTNVEKSVKELKAIKEQYAEKCEQVKNLKEKVESITRMRDATLAVSQKSNKPENKSRFGQNKITEGQSRLLKGRSALINNKE